MTPREGGACEQVSVNIEYLHGLRFELQEEKRKVEELEAEVKRLREELAFHKARKNQKKQQENVRKE